MSWLSAIDTDLFRFLNQTLSNRLFDAVIPFFSGNAFFVPLVLVLFASLVAWGGRRGRVLAFMLLVGALAGDGLVSNNLKKTFGRVRPCHVVPETRSPGGAGCSDSGSMPSSHSFNWAAATLVAFIYYRRSWRFMLPLACLVGFSRIYTGVHYPSDVLMGFVLGAGYAAAVVFGLEWLWSRAGPRWFPAWWPLLPSLIDPDATLSANSSTPVTPAQSDQTWLRFGYCVIGVLFVLRLVYLATGSIELSEDEAYQWTWSKHLALSYYSKPPMIAYTQFIGTSLWGDNAFGVRFFSPVISLIMSVLMLRFFAREISVKAGLALLAVVTTAPMLSVGSTLMTIDPLNVLFWTTAMLAGWRAIQNEGTIGDWLWVGFWMGLGFLSKYTALFQLLSWACVFALWPPARKHLRTAGPWLALVVLALSTVPVLSWNSQNGWITVTHLSERGGLDHAWSFTPKYFFEFLGAELGLLNPVFFIGMIWACVGFWKRLRHHPLAIYLFSMGAPLFVFYLLFTLRSRVLPNWIVPAVLPLFGLMVIYWREFLSVNRRLVETWFAAGLILGGTVVVVLHDTNLVNKITGRPFPARLDPLKRVRGWQETARMVAEERARLSAEGRDTFIIGDHYGITGEISFYLPEARASVRAERPLVYYRSSDHPENQFFFFSGYTGRKGDNAIFVRTLELPKLAPGWIGPWIRGEGEKSQPPAPLEPAPATIQNQFRNVTSLGARNIVFRDRVVRRIELFACRDLK